jgi:hypothetical protein
MSLVLLLLSMTSSFDLQGSAEDEIGVEVEGVGLQANFTMS